MRRQTTPRALLGALQSRASRVAITSSSMRGPACGDAIRVMREQTVQLDLRPFGITRRTAFAAALDEATEMALAALPKPCRHWGLARKGLNIFLRDCLYTHDIRLAYDLQLAEDFFELPLDSLTAKCLRQLDPALPRWRGVRALSVADSRIFQKAARAEASRRSLARVHLDAFWWGQRQPG